MNSVAHAISKRLFAFRSYARMKPVHFNRELTLTLLLVVILFSVIAQPICKAQVTEDARTKKNRCGGRNLETLIIERVAPACPPESRMHIKGDEIVKVTIDKNGKVVSARAICGHPLKKTIAVPTIKEWKFRPYVRNGKARQISGVVTIHFPPEESRLKD